MNYITQLINSITAQYPSLTDIQAIGRQNEEGVIVIDNKVYGGISDKKGNYAYIRYRGRNDWNHSRAIRQLSSIRTSVAEAELRLVVVHRLEDIEDFVSGLTEVMTGVFSCNAQASLEIVSTDQDRNRILKEETKGDNGKWNQTIGLVRVDFNFSYTYTGKACDPADLCGGGTPPEPIICPTLCELIEEATALEVVECFDEVKEEAIKELICDPCLPCEDAIYSNGGAFIVAIPSGDSYIAPEITVTDVDGLTRNVLPNIGVTCAWSNIAVKSTDDVVTLTTISSYPIGGVVNIGNQRIRQQDNSVIQVVPYRTDVKIINADISAVATVVGFTEITVVLPPPIVPSGIAYKAVAPMSMLPLTTGVNDSRALFISGWYDRTNPVYPVSYAEIDSAATQADVRVTPATGTLSTDSIIHTILKHNNAFGNKLRFTDSLGRASDATVGSDRYAHINWLGHSFSGAAIDYYVIDHLTGDGYMIKYVVDSGDYNLTNTAVGKTWASWMTAIASLNLGGFTDWKPLDCCSLRPHINKANLFESWANNFFISSRAAGEIAGQTDNRVTFVTGENANSLNFNALYDSGNASTIFPNSKNTSGGFTQVIANVFPIRRHYT